MNKLTSTRTFRQLFHNLKMRLLVLLGLFTDQNDGIPYPFMYFNQWNPHPFIYLKPRKGTPFGQSLPIWAIIGSIPPPPPPRGMNQTMSQTLNIIAGVFLEAIEVRDFFVKRRLQLKKQRLSTYDWKGLLNITFLNTFPFQPSVNQ